MANLTPRPGEVVMYDFSSQHRSQSRSSHLQVRPGEMVARYRAHERIGVGRSASVYRAVDTKNNQPVVLKVYRTGAQNISEYSVEVLVYSRVMAGGCPANIVRAWCTFTRYMRNCDHDVGVHPCIVLDNGKCDLYTLMRNARSAEHTGMPTPAVRTLSHDILHGIAALHRISVVHTDIKPHNIVVTSDGVAKICDFGSAIVDDDWPRCRLGTTEYNAPEMIARDAHSSTIDIWGYGVTIFELITGALLFDVHNTCDVVYDPDELVEPATQSGTSYSTETSDSSESESYVDDRHNELIALLAPEYSTGSTLPLSRLCAINSLSWDTSAESHIYQCLRMPGARPSAAALLEDAWPHVSRDDVVALV